NKEEALVEANKKLGLRTLQLHYKDTTVRSKMNQAFPGIKLGLEPLSLEAKEEIDKDVRANVPAVATMAKLTRKGLIEPSDAVRQQVYTRRSKTRNDENLARGLGKTFLEVKEYIDSISTEPATDHDPICLCSSIGSSQDFYAYFFTAGLLKAFADCPMLVMDHTNDLTWVGCATLLVGTHDEDGRFKLLCIGFSAKQDAISVYAALDGIKGWCEKLHINHHPWILKGLEADLNWVDDQQANNVRLYCHKHMADNVAKACVKHIRGQGKDSQEWVESERESFRLAARSVQATPNEAHFRAACILLARSWRVAHQGLVDYWLDNWVRRHCFWAQGCPNN
ncbi:hypothetical protein FOZ62_000890, partial [Perkinsus olseni]